MPKIYVEYDCNQFVLGVETCPSFLVSISQKELRRLRSDLVTAFKIFTGLLDIDPNLFFSSSRSNRLKRAPLQGNPRREPPPKERVVILCEGCEILE